MACNIFHLFGDLLQQSGSVSCPLAGLLPPLLASSWFYVWQFAGTFMICSIVSAAFGVANRCIFNATLKSHLHWGAPSLFMLFSRLSRIFLLFHPSVCVLSVLKVKTFALCRIPPLAAIQFAAAAINHTPSSIVRGKNLCICFFYTKETHLCVCVCLHWIMKVSGIQTNIIAASSFCLLHWEIIARDWTGINSWSTTWSSSQDSSNTFRLDLWSAS